MWWRCSPSCRTNSRARRRKPISATTSHAVPMAVRLSAGIHALVAARLGETETALRFLRQAAAADLELDPNSAGGIRIAGLGGLWQAIVLGFAGLGLDGDAITLTPRLPQEWRSMSFAVRWRGRPVQVRIAGDTVRWLSPMATRCGSAVGGETHSVQGGSALEVRCSPGRWFKDNV